MTTLPDLIARVKAATGPDREIDVDVAIVEGWAFDKRNGWRKPSELGLWVTAGAVPTYTASLDACKALLNRALPGWECTVNSTGIAWIDSAASFDIAPAKAATPELAVLAAILTAIEQERRRT